MTDAFKKFDCLYLNKYMISITSILGADLGIRFRFTASDGKMKVRALLQSAFSSEVNSGNIQNLGLIRILDYTLNDIPTKNEK